MKRGILFVLIFVNIHLQLYSQIGFKKDSVQIKVYTNISYTNGKATAIEVTKIFCDYCNESQLNKVKLKAWQTTHAMRKNPEYVIWNGEKRVIHFIRFKKEEF